MSDDETPHLPILERASYPLAMSDRTGAAKLAAIANLPIGWLLEDPESWKDGVLLTATGPEGSDRPAWGTTAEAAWWAMAEALADIGEGRMLPKGDTPRVPIAD